MSICLLKHSPSLLFCLSFLPHLHSLCPLRSLFLFLSLSLSLSLLCRTCVETCHAINQTTQSIRQRNQSDNTSATPGLSHLLDVLPGSAGQVELKQSFSNQSHQFSYQMATSSTQACCQACPDGPAPSLCVYVLVAF